MKRQSNYWKNSPEFWIFPLAGLAACDIGIFYQLHPTDLFAYYLLGPFFAAVIPGFFIALVHKIFRELGWNLLAATLVVAPAALIAGWFSYVWTSRPLDPIPSIVIGAAIYGIVGASASRVARLVASKRQIVSPNTIAGVFD